MPRTPEEIAYTDAQADRIGYIAPPPEIEPVDKIFVDARWTGLVDWFDANIPTRHGWYSAIQVYISRRYNTSIQEVYANVDDWAGGQFRRLDVRDAPEAEHSYGN